MRTITLIFCLISFWVQAQTNVSGKVMDFHSKEGVAFANVWVIGRTAGTNTSLDGSFQLEYSGNGTQLGISFVGYKTDTINIEQGVQNSIEVFLKPEAQELGSVNFIAPKYKNPNKELFKRITKNKKANAMSSLDYYECEIYNKIQVDLNQVGKFIKKNRIKSLDYIYDMIDSSAERSESFIPMFLSETVSEYYSSSKPKGEKELVVASKVSGLKNESISMLLGNAYTDFNLYTNFINAFDKDYVSPISDFGWAYYHYEITDTAYVGPYLSYRMSFKPRRKQEPAFFGEMWIDADSYAVTKIEMSLSKDANVNFIQSLKINRKYAKIESNWVKQSERLEMEANLLNSEKLVGVFIHKTTYWKKHKINEARDKGYYSNSQELAIVDSAMNRSEYFWSDNRGEDLSSKELQIYGNIDSLVNSKPFKWGVRFTKMFYTGYMPFKNWEFGPYYSAFSFNSIEGSRFRFGGRTKSNFSKKFRLNAYLAYGLSDEKFKGQLKGEYYFSKNPLVKMEAEYSSDYKQLSDSPDAFTPDNIMSSISRRTAPQFTLVDAKNISFLKEWYQGVSNQIKLNVNDFYPVAQLQFYRPDDSRINHFRISSVEFSGRIAIGEKFVMGDFTRLSLGTKKPILTYGVEYSDRRFLGSGYDFTKVFLQVKDKIFFGTLGRLDLVVDASKLWGNVPYPILLQHPGNSSYYFDKLAFNLMNPSEFVSDEFVSVKSEYHFDGLFLNQVPLVRKLKWRELLYGRSVIGDLVNDHEAEMLLPKGLGSLNGKPYVEVGVGIENMFKFIRIDYIVRLTNRGSGVSNSGIFAGLQLDL